VYRLSVSGRGSRPALDFSTTSIDFGPCFFPANPGVTPQAETQVLRITNNERDDDISIECLFEKKPHLEVAFDAMVLRPGQAVDVPVHFLPRVAGTVQESIVFEVNGLYPTSVNVTGEGTPARIVLSNPAQSTVSFGSLRVGQEAVRRVSLVNRSKRPASFVLEDVVKDVTTGRGALETCFVTFAPKEATLRPRESMVVELKLAPPQRLAAFAEPLMIRVAGDVSKLLTVTAACQGMEVKLETDIVNFGTVSWWCAVPRRRCRCCCYCCFCCCFLTCCSVLARMCA
jgi:hypothetical protein